jgi:hypothetical protein
MVICHHLTGILKPHVLVEGRWRYVPTTWCERLWFARPGDIGGWWVWYTGENVTLYLKRCLSFEWKWLGDYGL